MSISRYTILATMAVFSAMAGPIQFRVNGIFDTGATFSGTFTLDGDTNSIVESTIVTLSDRNFASTTYTSSGAGSPFLQGNDPGVPTDFSVLFRTPTYSHLFFFWLSGTPANFNGGPIHRLGPSCGVGQCTPSREINTSNGSYREVVSGTVEAVPEPAGLAIGALAIMGLSASKLRRSHHRRRS
jgi:hypothetical protein